MTGKKRPQFQGVTIFDANEEYITGAMAERKGMDLIVYAHVPANPDLETQRQYAIRSTTPDVVLQGIFQNTNNLAYVFSQIRLTGQAD